MSDCSIERLKNSGVLMRPAPFWSWNDKLDEAELRRQIREMAEKGWGSYFMHSRVGLVTGYLSDEWMNLVNACADEAEKTGTYAWLYDEDKWPSGYAGGEVPEKSESYRSRALVLVMAGSETANDTILCNFTCDLNNYSICKRVSPLDSTWFNGASYIDLMSPDAVNEFVNCTHEKYKLACGEHFGKAIPGIFTDEPCYLMHNQYDVPVVPWSDFLPDFFSQLKCYDLLDNLPKLFFDIENYRKVRFDFYDAATELFKQSFTKQYYDWCDTNGLIMTGHFMAEDDLRHQTQWSGDVMSHYEYMHWPGIDKLGRMLDQVVTCKQVSSVVDQLGKDRSFCEVYGCVGGQVSFFHRKWIGDWQAALGISFVNHHLSLYSMRGERKRDYPANFFYQQPWWNDEKGFADYQGRLCSIVSEGDRLVDILLLQPLASVWSEYSPLHKDSEYAPENAYDKPFESLSKLLLSEKLDYHYGNETLMAKYASVENGRLKVGKHTYSCVIVPPCENLRSSTIRLLKNYCLAGGKIIFIGSLPSLIDGDEAEVIIQGAVIVSSLEEAVTWVGNIFADRVQVTDLQTVRNVLEVYVHARSVGASTRYLFVNTDEEREVRTRIRIPGSESVVGVYDMSEGELYKLSIKDGSFDVSFAPAGSLVVICGEEAGEASSDAPAVLGCGASFKSFEVAPLIVSRNFECELLDENVLLLNDFMLEMDGKQIYEGPVCGAWHKYFYPAPDGTPFKATYTFHSACKLAECFAAIEVAENLDSISLNGQKLSPAKAPGEAGKFDPAKSWKDINFIRVPLPRIKAGSNKLVIEGKKVNNITGPGFHNRVDNWIDHYATEAEEIYICGNFAVRSLSDSLYEIAAPEKLSGKDLAAEGYPFYCGRVRMKTSFDLAQIPDAKVFLKLIDVEAASVSLSVNGQDIKTLRWKPFIVDVSNALKTGENKLELVFSTNLVNAFGPNRTSGIKNEIGVGPHDFVDIGRFTTEYQLFQFGIAGAALLKLQ